MNRGYQYNFSSMHGDSMYDKEAREGKANTMVRVLSHHFGQESVAQMSLLDVGSSTGFIDNYLSKNFAMVTGIDIDTEAIDHASKTFSDGHLHFCVGDAMSLDFPENSFDVVICSQIYEHVPDARRMMDEIYRVLKPEGVCYFAAGNRLSIEEHHYQLPFLSVIPRPLGHLYIRLAGKGKYYYEKHLSYWGLKSLVEKFEVVDYTGKIIDDPAQFNVIYMLEPGSKRHKIAKFVVNWLYWACPGYIWLLRKPN